jgi:hypothetical protein
MNCSFRGAISTRCFEGFLTYVLMSNAITNAVKQNMRAIEDIIVKTPAEIARSVHEAYTWASGKH